MKRIKKFESFSHRSPEKVTYKEWLIKYKRFGGRPFTEKEIELFQKLKEENPYINNVTVFKSTLNDIEKSEIRIQLCNMDEDDDIIEIQLNKLEDEWYLICESCGHDYEEFFICDEWDEVVGYLESKNLTLPS